jgi:hypothetical protein
MVGSPGARLVLPGGVLAFTNTHPFEANVPKDSKPSLSKVEACVDAVMTTKPAATPMRPNRFIAMNQSPK